jgi:hypothetical protein
MSGNTEPLNTPTRQSAALAYIAQMELTLALAKELLEYHVPWYFAKYEPWNQSFKTWQQAQEVYAKALGGE